MSEAFGARLRDKRERQDIPLRTIAEQTKIKLSLLEGLERGDVSHWPSGIFRRAFVRAYAQAIGLEPDAVVREFLELYPDPGEDVATISRAAMGNEPVGPIARLRAAVGATFRPRDAQATEPQTVAPPVEPAPVKPPVPADPAPAAEPAFAAIAQLCTALGRVEEPHELTPLLEQVATVLDASGLILWVWDLDTDALRPTLAHGYSPNVLAQLPSVERDADNATAAAFRLAQTCVVKGSDRANGALAVPVMVPFGCGGVLALELRHGREQVEQVRAAAEIVSAQLAAMMRVPGPAAAADRKLA